MTSVCRLLAVPLAGVLLFIQPALAQDGAGPTPLTLVQAVDEAMANSPRVASADAAVKAARGLTDQADTSPNPTLDLQGSNLAGDGIYKQVDNSDQYFYGLSQQIELGGKRTARREAAQMQQRVAVLDATIARLDVQRDVKQAFAAAVASQESERLAEDALNIAQQELKSVSRRVAEAASPLIQKSKAEVTLATAKFNVEQARQDAAAARTQLATLLGRSSLGETLDASSFFEVDDTTTDDADAIERTPDMLRLRLMEDHAQALLDIEKAGAIPDPTINAGVSRLQETGDQAFVVGLSIPLPVMNSNRGNITAARAQVTRTASDQQAARLELLQRYQMAKTGLRTAHLKATSYNSTVLPAAEDAFKLSRQGYGAGKFQYLEVLDAQRTLFGARAEYMAALRDYHMRKAELERLTTPHTTKNTKGESNANQ
jgi:cobalt-zinc-cadmium efflux system outer membrane protein